MTDLGMVFAHSVGEVKIRRVENGYIVNYDHNLSVETAIFKTYEELEEFLKQVLVND